MKGGFTLSSSCLDLYFDCFSIIFVNIHKNDIAFNDPRRRALEQINLGAIRARRLFLDTSAAFVFDKRRTAKNKAPRDRENNDPAATIEKIF